MGNTKTIGYVAAITATLLLGSVGVFVRNISANGYVITFARLGLGLVFLFIFLFFQKQIGNIKATKVSFPLFSTGVLLAATSLCYINAINIGSLSSAAFLLYLGPLIAVGVAAVFLKERFTFINGGLLCLAFLGFLFLLDFNFSFNINESKGYLWGIGSAICYAFYIVLNRKIPKGIPVLIRSFYQLLIGTIATLPFLDSSLFNVTVKDVYWLMAIGILQGFIAFTFIILALKHLKAVEYSIISYVEPLIASLIGFVLYSERLTVFQFIGCVIVFAVGMIQVIMDNEKSKLIIVEKGVRK